MSTPFNIDSRLSNLFENTENLVDKLILILSENYISGNLSIGTNTVKKFKNKEAFYTLVDSDFENIFLTFVHKNNIKDSLYEIRLETMHDDYPTQMQIKLSSDIEDKLPPNFISDLFDKIHDFVED